MDPTRPDHQQELREQVGKGRLHLNLKILALQDENHSLKYLKPNKSNWFGHLSEEICNILHNVQQIIELKWLFCFTSFLLSQKILQTNRPDFASYSQKTTQKMITIHLQNYTLVRDILPLSKSLKCPVAFASNNEIGVK